MRGVVVACAAVVLLASSPASATKLTGKIIVTAELREALAEAARQECESNQLYYWRLPNGVIPVEPPAVNPATDIAVVLFREGAPDPGPAELTIVKVHAGGFEERVVVTRPGSTIRFRNVDPYDHELYSPAMATFRPERQSNGSFRPIDFPIEGAFDVRCQLMPFFKGYIVATKATTVLEVAKDGTFTLELPEAGKYTLKVFHEGAWIHEQSFQAGGGDRVLNLEIKLQPGKAPSTAAPGADKKQGKADGGAK